jgi:hypothetical protein
VFTLFTSIALWLDSRFTSSGGGSEAYTTAGRAVKAGLTACDIVSEWLRYSVHTEGWYCLLSVGVRCVDMLLVAALLQHAACQLVCGVDVCRVAASLPAGVDQRRTPLRDALSRLA